MARFRLTVGHSARGMTLLEVLAAVFCLGMGLIMVAGAFPAGAHQTRLTIQQTEASLMAASAADYVAVERQARRLTKAQIKGDSKGGLSVPLNINEEWLVWNPDRLAYLDDFDERKLLPPGGGDFILRPFLTRLSSVEEAPLYRMTIVVGRYSKLAPDFYDVKLMRPVARTVRVERATGNVLTCSGIKPPRTPPTSLSEDHVVKTGDYIMNPRTGYCYRVASVDDRTSKVTLTETPPGPLDRRINYYVFRNVIGVFYQLISD